MKVFVSQFYIETAAKYPFTVDFQRYVSRLFTRTTVNAEKFSSKYGDDFSLVINVSAKSSLNAPEVLGRLFTRRTKRLNTLCS